LLDGLFWVSCFVADGSRILEYFVIIAAFVAFVAPEVDFLVIMLDKLQAVGFVPAEREHVKADLATYAVLQTIVWEFSLEHLNEYLAYSMLFVILFKCISLIFRAVTTYGANIYHTVASFYMVTCFDRNAQLVNVILAEITKLIKTLSA